MLPFTVGLVLGVGLGAGLVLAKWVATSQELAGLLRVLVERFRRDTKPGLTIELERIAKTLEGSEHVGSE
jgi:hypothetical protein